MSTIIEAIALKKSYKRKADTAFSLFKRTVYEEVNALKGIDFKVLSGERVGFIGLNGAGKSTTIKLLTGILHPDEGTVKLFGKDSYTHRKKNAERIGVLFGQRSHLIWDLPFRHSLELLKKVYKIEDSAYKAALKEADTFLNIEELLGVPVRTMSLGQRMKCEFTAITLHRPELFVLDEPTIGLDIVTRRQIKAYLSHLNETTGATVFLTTHDLSEIEKLCQRVIVISEGVVIAEGSLAAITAQVADTFAEIKTRDAFSAHALSGYNAVTLLEERPGLLKIKVPTASKEVLVDLMKIEGVDGVTVYTPNLEELMFSLLQKG